VRMHILEDLGGGSEKLKMVLLAANMMGKDNSFMVWR